MMIMEIHIRFNRKNVNQQKSSINKPKCQLINQNVN